MKHEFFTALGLITFGIVVLLSAYVIILIGQAGILQTVHALTNLQ